MKYYRLMLGKASIHAQSCFAENFVGVNFAIAQDLTNTLSEGPRSFNATFIPIHRAARPEKSKIAAGLACGMLWTVCKGIKIGDLVLCPDGSGSYRVAEIISSYVYVPDQILPHRREVRWLPHTIERIDMSDALRHSAGSIGTVCDISAHQEEIERLLGRCEPPVLIVTDESIENPASFALERHLEDFLVANWTQTELGRDYDIYEEDGECIGQQYNTDGAGTIDILAIRKDKKELLVVELKKGRAPNAAVGQVLSYMGYVAQELAEADQAVRGVIIAQEDDQRIRRALAVTPNVSFYKYQVSFKLLPA